MKCKLTKKPNTVFVETTRLVTWESPEGSREPVPSKREYKRDMPFGAAGWPYLHPRQLTLIPLDRDLGLFQDGYGRRVLLYKERYPCFDSYDYATENRYYRWCYISYKDELTCVYWTDDGKTIQVTEDVAEVPGNHYDAMVAAGVVDENDILDL